MKRIFSLILALMAVQMMWAAVHSYEVKSSLAEGKGTLDEIVTEINELPEEDEAVITFNVSDTIRAEETQFVIRRIVSIKGGTSDVIIKSKGFVFPDTIVKEISNVKFFCEDNKSQALLFYKSVNKIVDCAFVGYDRGILLSNMTIDLIQNCTFECNEGIYGSSKPNVIDRCVFNNCKNGIVLPSSYGSSNGPAIKAITNCKFNNCLTCINVFSESIEKISGCKSDGGVFDLHSIRVLSFDNNSLMGDVNFYSSVDDLKNCYFGATLRTYNVNIKTISETSVVGKIDMTSGGEISDLRNSNVKSGIYGSAGSIKRMFKDTISNLDGSGIQIGNISLIDSCLIHDCKTGIETTNIDTIRSSKIYECTGYGIKSNNGKSVGLLSHCDIYNCTSGIFCSNLGRIEYSNIYNNTEYGIDGRYSQIETIYECTISDNKKSGITSGQGTLKKLLNSIIKNNGIGFDNQTGKTEIIRNCSFIDNEECAVYFNNATLDSISDCFLSGSKTAIKFERVSGSGINFTILENNVIGKDGKHADFKGNTIGVFISNMCGVVLENNIISGNKSSGIAIDQKPSVTIRNNFIGTNLSGDALGNGVGVKLYDYVGGSQPDLNGNLIAYNDSGVVNLGERMMVKNNTFKANLKCGISYGCSPSVHDDIRTNQFLNSPVNSKAIDLSSMIKTNVIATPVITSVSTPDKDGYVFVNGKVETKEKVKVEIFMSDGRGQNALEYLSCDSTDVNGNFKVKVKAPDQLLLSFIALASKDEYYDLSEFSNTYTVPLKGPFYVKTKREGTGDGSSWENAMDGDAFETYLPLAPDGATFHIAAGTYMPKKEYVNQYGISEDKRFVVNSSVRLIGGYSDKAKEGDKPNPALYETVFSGDVNGDTKVNIVKSVAGRDSLVFSNNSDDLNYVLYCSQYKMEQIKPTISESDTAFYLYGIVIRYSKYRGVELDHSYNAYSIVENSTFEYNEHGAYLEHSAVIFVDCKFKNNNKGFASHDGQLIYNNRSINFRKCTFCYNNYAMWISGLYTGTTYVENSTIVDNFASEWASVSSYLSLVNNTILNNGTNVINRGFHGDKGFVLKGNIIDTLAFIKYGTATTFFKSYYNYGNVDFSENSEVEEDNNLPMKGRKELSSFVDGTYDAKSDVFIPEVKNNGGFTPTVALKSDKISDDKSIRFPRLENVLTDQRGELREDMTCMGAYELPAIDTVFVRDTIVLGETYAFNDKNITPEKIGWLQDTMLVKKDNKEIPYVLQLCVIPKKSSYYYVKKVAEGNGSGSSWKNAMSGDDFAFTLPFANSGTKFYVAEGVYNPIYDASGEESDDPTSLCYRIKNNITIYGGYPADAQIGATADPENHPTVFSGDHKGDDKVVKGVDENGRLKLTYSNRDDNSKQLFEANKCDVTFNNVIVDGASTGIISNGDVTRFYGNNVTFRNCDYAVLYTSNKAVIFIDGSKFENIRSGCLFTPNGWNTNVTSTVFSGNTGYIAYSASEGMMSFDRVTVTGNNAQIYSSNNVELKISNSEFINNDNSGSLIYMVNKDRETTPITNSLFKGNKNQIFEFNANTSLTIDSCSFVGNTNRILYAASGSKTSIGRCVFEKNILPTIDDKKSDLVFSYGNVDVKSSSYFDNECGNLVSVASVDVENSTFVKNDVKSIIYQSADGDKFRLVNNTIISNKISSYPLYAHLNSHLHGNIVLGNKLEGKVLSDKKYDEFELSVIHDIQEFEFNLMDIIRKNPQTSEDDDISTYIPDNSTNLLVKPREITIQKGYSNCKACEYATDNSEEYYLTNLFEGTLDSKTGTFIPTIKNNGGATPTVALKSDKLSDGRSIRFPRLENVLTDQRGVSRFDETCMGAYELGCVNDTTFTTDTIYVGEKILGQTFTKVGVHDSIFETLKSSLDCDSVVMHRVVVKPDPKTFNYYVKMTKEGRGDGSDWDNAMDSIDFATYLPLAPDGATFYVAAGTYKPVYDVNMNIPSDLSDLCYAINSSVTIRGGYPADAKGKEVPSKPKKYETIFDGDIKGDAKSGIQTLFLAKIEKQFSIYGLNFVHTKDISSSSAAIISNGMLTVNQCVFDSCFCAILLKKGSFASIDSSIFTKSWAPSINVEEGASLTTSNSKFEDNVLSSPSKSPVYFGAAIYSQGVIDVNNCIFRNNKVGMNGHPSSGGGAIAIVSVGSHSNIIKNSYFENNVATHGGAIYLLNGDSVLIEGCTFTDNYTLLGQGNAVFSTRRGNNTRYKCLSNNTFYRNDDKEYLINTNVIESDDITHVVNNTIVGNHVPCFNLGNALIEGNIIVTDTTIGKFSGIFSKLNVVSDNILVEGAISVPLSEIAFILDGSYDMNNNSFTPELKNNGGFTPTVALKSDKLSDGTSIRFPRLENVLTDQRGVERFDSTCMGAYEMRCNAVDTVLKDTVMVGDSYTFIDKNLDDVCQKVGSYHFTETLKTEEGCDSIVKLSLAVRPQKNENGYYVKEDGTGDGSDWNNAMSPKDFAEYLPLVYDGETFHIAAGTYKSTYVDPELGRMYNINSSVTLIGGYPDTVTSTSTPSMPDVYVTKLTADVNGNDYTYYYPNSLEYTPYSNVKDNDSILIRVNGAKTLNLFGMTLSGVKSCDRGAVDLADGASLVMDRCFVQDNVASGVYGKGVDVKVTNSVFTHNYSNNGAAFNLVDSKLNVQSTAVYENRAKVEECKSEYAMGGVANLENTEATFENSTLSNNAADLGSVFSVKSSKLDLTNNTIVGNQIIPESKHKGSFIGSLDDKSSVSLFGNIVIGNQNGEFDGVVNVASSDYNVFSYKTDMSYGSHDMVMNDPKEVQMLLDGDFAFESETVFIPNIQYNGGYTPTVAVIQSAFDGGKILNIPLDDRKVTYDQRGFVRKDSSCIGAFEFPTFMGYYVKKQAHGDGSGRDWENSMNDTTFAKYFSVVPTNASFYVAEGVYSPMFDSYGKLSTNKSRRYSSSRLVNIYGGYPDSAQTGCEADPVKYKTVLSVDYNGDDKYVVSDNDFTSIDVLNSQDNGYSIVNITSKFPGWVEINGVEFRGQRCVPRASSAAVQILGYNVSGVNTRIEKCSFVGNYAAIYSGCDTTIIEECLFDSLDYCGLSVSSFSLSENNYLLVDKTTFANSLYQLSASSFRGLMRVQNSTFANALYGVTTPLDFMSTPENTKIEIYNNSFFSGKKEDCSLLVYDYIPVELKGNIISSKKLIVKPDQNGKYESKPIVSDYNVYTTEIDAYPLGENDTIVPQSSIGEIVKGVVENDIFEATLDNQGIYVKMLPSLVNVNFSDGGGIKKMQEKVTPVTDDQRGVVRPSTDYCIGSIEADCEFSGSKMNLNTEKTVVCRGDSVELTVSGLTLLEKNSYKYKWESDDVGAIFSNPSSYDSKIYLKGQNENVEAKLTITNVCGNDTVLSAMIKVNGTGEVPFTGIDESGTICLNVAEPIELSTEVDGAKFKGECIVNGHFFDPTLAKADSTVIRCYIVDEVSGCDIYTEKVVHIQSKDETANPVLNKLRFVNQSCGSKPNGMIKFEISDVTENLTYRVDGPDFPANKKETKEEKENGALWVTIDSINAGDYQVSITDGCYDYAMESFTVEDKYSIKELDAKINNINCFGENDGEVILKYEINKDIKNFELVLNNIDNEEKAVLDLVGDSLHISQMSEGVHELIFQSTSNICPDIYKREFSISGPSTYFKISELNVEGVGCDANITPVVTDPTNDLVFNWTSLVSYKETTTTLEESTLKNSGAGKTMCVAYSEKCDRSDTAYVDVPSSSDAVDNLTITPYAIDESCMGANNGRIKCVVDSVNNKRVAVTVVVEALSNGVKTLNTYNREDNVIRFESLEPGDYRVTAYQGSPECVDAPSDFDTTLTIRPMLNSLTFHSLDKVVDAVCLSDLDASAQLTAIGVPAGLNMQVLKDGKVVNTYKYSYRISDTATYVADKLVSGDYLARIVNGCSDTTEQKFTIGGTLPFEVSLDSSSSVFTYDCFDTESEKGSVKIICTGGSDSMLVSLNLYDRKNPTVSSEITAKKLYKKDMPYSISYTDLLSGKYFVRLQTLLPDCDDKQDLEFAIKGNDFITLDSLVVDGVGCDATIEPYASGDETGYTFYWNNSISHKERTSTGTLLNAGAGTFSCVAVSNRCQAYSDTLFVDVPSVSDPIEFNVTLTSGNESCYGANNGAIRCEVDSVNGERVPVTIVAESIDADTLIQASYDNVNHNDNVIRLWYLKPGEYHVTAYQGSPECVEAPSDFDTVVVIKPMLNKLKFLSVDSITDAICLSDSDAHAYVTAIGVAGGQHIQCLYPNDHIEEFGYFKRNEDTASFHIRKLVSGDFTARIINSCKDTVLQKFSIGGTKPYVVNVDSSKSVLEVKCPYDTTGVIVAKFSGGYDSCRYAFYKLNSTKTAIVATLKENSILTKDSEQTVKVTGLGKGQYKIVLATTVPGCADHKSFYIEIKGPADVVDKKELLDISCSSFNDGSISFKPYRLGVPSTQYVIHRDSALIKEHYDAYLLFKAVQTEVVNGHGDKVNGYVYEPVYFNGDENHQIVVRINKAFNRNEFYYREDNSIVKIQNIDELNASAPRLYQNDFVDSSFKWYKKSNNGWSQLNILMPDSSDVEEAWYFRTKNGQPDTIKLEPVWGCSHLEEFWEDHLGDYLEPDAITLANLAPAWYKVVYNDSVGCVYSDSFEIKKPQRPLMFDSVRFLSNLAKCDPTKRYITAYVDGGWGEYNYSFAREGQVYTKNNSRYDGYLGGNYIKFDTTKLKGICRSEFLLPGVYTVTVVDKKGCFVKYNNGAKIVVASEFTATVDTVNVLCPGGDDAPVVVNIFDKTYNGTYNIYEYDSDCLTNTCDTCNRDTITLRKENAGKEVHMKFGDGTHGLFIFRTSADTCGTYVPAVVTDTIPPMRIQLEAKSNVSCAAQPEHLTKDGMIKLSLLGGTQPYTLFRDKELFSDEHIQTYKEFKDSMIMNEKGEVIKTVKIINLENLEAGRYYFTIKDYNKCIRHMGEDNNDTVVVLKSPDPISTLIASSSICPKSGDELAEGVVFADESSSGAVFAKYVEGGTEPYEYVVDGFPAENVNDPYIYVSGDESSQFHYVITDALGCTYDTTVMFGQDRIEVKRIDFMASKYNKNGDVIALIDFCGPEDYFDSVRYEISGVNAKKFEILDRRMYIYDIQGGNKTAKEALLKLTDTKSVPDAFFAQNFELIDKYSLLGKHINFIKLNDTLSSKGNMDVWRQCELTMYAYFKGCRYTLNQNGLGVIKSDIVISGDDFDWYEGGVKSNNDILDISLSPNPYTPASGDVLSVDVTFGAKVDYKIYIYSMNGNISYEFEGHASDLKESRVKGEYVVSKSLSESDLKLSQSEAFVVLVQTDHDSDAELLLVKVSK